MKRELITKLTAIFEYYEFDGFHFIRTLKFKHEIDNNRRITQVFGFVDKQMIERNYKGYLEDLNVDSVLVLDLADTLEKLAKIEHFNESYIKPFINDIIV